MMSRKVRALQRREQALHLVYAAGPWWAGWADYPHRPATLVEEWSGSSLAAEPGVHRFAGKTAMSLPSLTPLQSAGGSRSVR